MSTPTVPQKGYRLQDKRGYGQTEFLRVTCQFCPATTDVSCKRLAEVWIRQHKKVHPSHKLFFTNILTDKGKP